ncbi:MAG: CDP-archaeol synthase [Methylobacter sp.]|nr:CDP-archaeol synthase [Methylococcales bacterium]MDD5113138.1 CDP-archaeol synthase [Methylobacter sp.]
MIELSLCVTCSFQALILLLAANGAPVLATLTLGKRWTWPVDFGYNSIDGKRLLGNSKTWRGVCSAMLITATVAMLFDLNLIIGAVFGMLTMLGDCVSSFIKRRLGYSQSSHARGLDTVPESLLPTLFLKQELGLGLTDILLLALVFFLLEEFVSPVLYQWHIRNRPY